MSQTGIFNSNESLDISTFYEMAVFTDNTLSLPLPTILVSNDNITWCKYRLLDNNYLYLADLMANYIKVENEQPLTLHYNANLKE